MSSNRARHTCPARVLISTLGPVLGYYGAETAAILETSIIVGLERVPMAIHSDNSAEQLQEFLSCEARLKNDGREGSAVYFLVTRDDHEFSISSQHHMASSLPRQVKPDFLKNPHHFTPRSQREPRQ